MKKFTTLCVVLFAAILIIGWQKQPEYKLKLTESDINIVIEGLQELPHKKSAIVIQKIIGQAQDTAFQRR